MAGHRAHVRTLRLSQAIAVDMREPPKRLLRGLSLWVVHATPRGWGHRPRGGGTYRENRCTCRGRYA